VVVENDVNAAALGAWAVLGGDPTTTLSYLSIGTGFAVGTVIGGDAVRGGRGLAGEIGHVPYPDHTTPCPCGQVGCIETIVSGQALTARMAAGALGSTAIDLWDAADAGDALAEELRSEFVDVLAWAGQVALMLLDVDHVVIGGGVGVALGDRLVDRVRERLRERHAASPLLGSIAGRVRAAPGGVELGALGAHLSAGRQLFDTGVPS
jgi:predicted NBD/HSP70 family sugar kinase